MLVRSVRTPYAGAVSSFSESSIPVLVLPYRAEVVAFAEVPPVDVGEVEFAVHALPDHEVAEAFRTGLDDEVGVVREDESVLDGGLVDVLGFEVAVVDGAREIPDGGRELVAATEPDTDRDRGVRALRVLGFSDRDLSRCVQALELARERRCGGAVEDAHVDGDVDGTVLERPREEVAEGVVRALFEEVAFRDDESDVLGDGRVRRPHAEREIAVVQAHDRLLRRARS